jgi:hypothetical protein
MNSSTNNIELAITEQLQTLEDNIRKYLSDPTNESVAVWKEKRKVLLAALDYLHGDIDPDTLNTIMELNPQYNYDWSLLYYGWYPGSSGTTAKLMERVVLIKPVLKQPKSFTQISPSKNLMNSALLFVASWQNNVKPFGGEYFPPDVMRYILSHKHALDVMFMPALQHAANGEYDQLKALLDENPYLVLLRGDVTTPGGLTVKNTTLLECAIGAGDWAINENSPGMAEMIMGYFDKVKGGASALESQLERCRTCLLELEHQKAYDLTGLMRIIKKASPNDVKIALSKKNNDSDLCKAIIQFRDDVRPGTITEPHMHYNYQTLIHALLLLDQEWEKLSEDQQDLFWRQVIGYLQRSLPAVNRFIFARGSLYSLVQHGGALERSLEYKYAAGFSFPSCSAGDSDCSGPGFDIAIYAGARVAHAGLRQLAEARGTLQKLMSNKNFSLAKLMQRCPKSETSLNMTY